MEDSSEDFPLSLENPIEPDTTDDPIYELELRQKDLNERIISLKAITETVKNKISCERELWLQELRETVKLEKQLKQKRESEESLTTFQEDEYKRKLEVFKDFLFFSQTSEKLKKILMENNYQKWLDDLSVECALELDKVSQSLTALKPLKKIVSQWNVQSEADSGISENKDSYETENEPDILEKGNNYYGYNSLININEI